MSGERILVIDDGKENRDFIMDYVLRPNGFEGLTARDGLEGLEMARHYRPDLILLDLQMPRMNGMEVLDALNAEQMNIPVILMTFHGSEEIAIEVYRKGVRDYLKKPYTVEEMYEAIDRSLAIVRLQKEKDQLTERLISVNAAMNQRVRELNVLYSIGKTVTSLIDIQAVLMKVAEAAAQLTSSEESAVYIWEQERLICRAVHRQGEGRTYPMNEVRPDPLALTAIHSRQPAVLTPEELQALRQHNPSAPTAAMAAPLLMAEQAIGALVVRNFSGAARVFARNDAGLLSALSDYAAIAYSKASQYAAPKEENTLLGRALAAELLGQVDGKTLGAGTRRPVSLLSLRWQGHLNFAQKAPPEQLVSLINDYWHVALEQVFDHQGMVAELGSDHLLALYNAPINLDDHPLWAAKAALALRGAAEQHYKKRGGGLTCGLALHLGEVVLGYWGQRQYSTYGAVGEAVHLAHQMRAVAKPGQILMSEAFMQQVAEYVQVQAVGKIPYRGWQDGIPVFELGGMKD
jgi:DNA-binding response OmpR family regulator/class 3 adenylate cyclase